MLKNMRELILTFYYVKYCIEVKPEKIDYIEATEKFGLNILWRH